jgi:protein-S-isoprenylcysteine O-methyltransferase Ste14
MIDIIRWFSLLVWLLWLVLYWGAGLGLVSNFLRAFQTNRFFYDRYFIIGLILLSNIILWSGYFLVTDRISPSLTFGTKWLVWAGGVLVFVGALGTFWCRRQMRDSWSAHTVLVENHRLVDSGPYAVVRHPIYAFACLMTIGTVLVFPVWWNFIAGAGMITLYVFKLQFEERMLIRELDGYREYRHQVRYRLVPYIW